MIPSQNPTPPPFVFELPSARLVPPPRNARRVAQWLTFSFFFLFVVAIVTPWQQNVTGSGQVIAYAPDARQPTIEAPVDGRPVRWWVSEGSHVRKGDPILELSDNDPLLVSRLEAEKEALEMQLESYTNRSQALETRVGAVTRAMQGSIASAEAQVRVANQKLKETEQAFHAAEANVEAVLLQLARQRLLFEQGLTPKRELELAQLEETRARTGRERAEAAVNAAHGELEAKKADLARALATRDAELNNATASSESATSDAAKIRGELQKIDVRIARQATQLVRAPRNGSILKLLAFQHAQQVKRGDPLVAFVPETDDRAVELWLDGNDASLVTPGRHVRLQFEGWPAVQFAGWPSVAVGTFGGRVAFIDAADDGKGNFRIVIIPDAKDEKWPPSRYLRQGVQTNGWVLLNRVPLGYELWRQFNGFPPSVTRPAGA